VAARKSPAPAPRRAPPAAPAGDRKLDGLLDLVGYNIRRADIFMHQHFARAVNRHAIRPAEYAVLTLIRESARATQADIAAALSIKRPNLVGLVLRLEHRGLLARAVSEQDRRNHVLSLTPKGRGLLARVRRVVRDQDRRVTQCWTDAERRRLIELLRRLYALGNGRGDPA
jgi:DNA-binding MarR family transcriptional regulator